MQINSSELASAESTGLSTAACGSSKRPGVAFFSTEKANAPYDIDSALAKVLRSHNFVLGAQVAAFEQEFADYCGTSFACGVANGTDALELSLRAVGVKHGDTVATVANAGFYTSAAALSIGAKPVYVDVGPNTRTMCPGDLAEVLAHSPCDCIVVTHLFGQLADMAAIQKLAGQYKVPIVEDCAQAHGARRDRRISGSIGHVAAFSFYPTKNLGALGDGGAVVTSDPTVDKRLRSLRQYGWGNKYEVVVPGGKNSRLDELQAAVLRVKLPHLDQANRQRISTANAYNKAFADLPIICPKIKAFEHVCHLYVIESANRDQLKRFLQDRGIQVAVHYPIADHQQKIIKQPEDRYLRRTEQLMETILSLPCYPGMPAGDIEKVISAVQHFFTKRDSSCSA